MSSNQTSTARRRQHRLPTGIIAHPKAKPVAKDVKVIVITPKDVSVVYK